MGASPTGQTIIAAIPLWPTKKGTDLVNRLMRVRIPPEDPVSMMTDDGRLMTFVSPSPTANWHHHFISNPSRILP